MKWLQFVPLMASSVPPGSGSPIPGATSPEAALAATNAAASARLDALLIGNPEPIVRGSSAEPIPSPAPAPPAGNEPAPGAAPPAPPAGNEPAPAPGAPAATPATQPEQITVKVAELDPAARQLLARYGFNVETALAEALRNGNLVATLTKERRQGAWTAPTAPSGMGQPMAEAPLPVSQIDPNLIETQARSLLDGDQAAKSLLTRAVEIRNEHSVLEGDPRNGIIGKIPTLQAEIATLQASLRVPEVQADSLKTQDLNMQVLMKQSELLRMENRAQSLKTDYRDVSARYRARHADAVNYVRGQHDQVYNEYAARSEEQAEFNDAADTIVAVWPGAMQRAIAEYKIGQDQIPDFQAFAKLHANAAPDEIEDIEGFVRTKAQEFAAMTDRAHRARSAAFGQMATDRHAAAAGAPAGTAPQGSAPAPSGNQPTFSSDPLRDVQRKVEESWAAFASGR